MGRLLRRNCPRERRRSRSAAGLRLRLGELAPAAAPEVPPGGRLLHTERRLRLGAGQRCPLRPGRGAARRRPAGLAPERRALRATPALRRTDRRRHVIRRPGQRPATRRRATRTRGRTGVTRGARARNGAGAGAAPTPSERSRAAAPCLLAATADDVDRSDADLRVRGGPRGARLRQGPDPAHRARGRAAAIGGLRRLARGRHGDGRSRAAPHHTAFRPRVRDRGLLSRPATRRQSAGSAGSRSSTSPS